MIHSYFFLHYVRIKKGSKSLSDLLQMVNLPSETHVNFLTCPVLITPVISLAGLRVILTASLLKYLSLNATGGDRDPTFRENLAEGLTVSLKVGEAGKKICLILGSALA